MALALEVMHSRCVRISSHRTATEFLLALTIFLVSFCCCLMEASLSRAVKLASLLDVDVEHARAAMELCEGNFDRALDSFFQFASSAPAERTSAFPAADSAHTSAPSRAMSTELSASLPLAASSQDGVPLSTSAAASQNPGAARLPPLPNPPSAALRPQRPKSALAATLASPPRPQSVCVGDNQTSPPKRPLAASASATLDAHIKAAQAAAILMKRVKGDDDLMGDYQPYKRQRLMPLPPDVLLLGNDVDLPCSNPLLFQRHQLRDEQLRSLQWMLSQEEQDGLKGGVLGDKMGYGKTATTIGLISLDKSKPDIPLPVVDCVPTRATLILCPPRLQQQWEDEIIKFLGVAVDLWQVLGSRCERVKKAEKSPHLKVLSITTTKQCGGVTTAREKSRGEMSFPTVTVRMLQTYDVVIVPINLMQHRCYINSVKLIMDDSSVGSLTSLMLKGMKEAFKSDKLAASARLSTSPFPVLQAFWWHRVVIDEFHESSAWDFRNRELVKAIGATHRWGLSGTPPFSTSVAVTEVARLLWYPQIAYAPAMQLWLTLEGARGARVGHFIQYHGLELEAEALTFLKNNVRQNSSRKVEDIKVKEHFE